VLIEDSASGQSLIQELRIDTNLPLRPVKVDGDKNVRAAAAAQPAIGAGRVLLPAGAVGSDEFLAEVCAFPAGVHDDFVDTLTQAIGYLRRAGQQMASGISRARRPSSWWRKLKVTRRLRGGSGSTRSRSTGSSRTARMWLRRCSMPTTRGVALQRAGSLWRRASLSSLQSRVGE
jgi:hypothetical protein